MDGQPCPRKSFRNTISAANQRHAIVVTESEVRSLVVRRVHHQRHLAKQGRRQEGFGQIWTGELVAFGGA
jgi:hypothetical protein